MVSVGKPPADVTEILALLVHPVVASDVVMV